MLDHLETSNLVPSGIPAVDEAVGGLPIRWVSLIQGPPRSGKTGCALAFTRAALMRGERCLFVTMDDPDVLRGQALRGLGYDLLPALQDKRLTVLSPGLCFSHKLRSLGSAERALDELGQLVWRRRIDAVVFDTFDVVLAGAEPTMAKRFVRSAVAPLFKLPATTLLTSYGESVPELAFAARELAAAVPTVLALDDSEACKKLAVRTTWTQPVPTMPVELARGSGLILQQRPALVSVPSLPSLPHA